MGIISSGVKALTKSGAKKAAPKATKKARPKLKEDPVDIAFTAGVAVPGLGLTAIANQKAVNSMEANRAKRQSDLASARGKPGSRAIGADKFGWAGRR
jgi:hypothetical protein